MLIFEIESPHIREFTFLSFNFKEAFCSTEENISTNLDSSSIRINQKSDQETSVNLEAELNQLEIIKNKQLITSEEYIVMRKNLLGL